MIDYNQSGKDTGVLVWEPLLGTIKTTKVGKGKPEQRDKQRHHFGVWEWNRVYSGEPKQETHPMSANNEDKLFVVAKYSFTG